MMERCNSTKTQRLVPASEAILQLSCRDFPQTMRALNSSANSSSAREGWAQPGLEELPCPSRGADSWAGAPQNPVLLGTSLPAATHRPMALPDVACPFTAHICPDCCGDGGLAGPATTTAVLGEL